MSLRRKGEAAFPPCFSSLPSSFPILEFDLAYHFENDRHLMG